MEMTMSTQHHPHAEFDRFPKLREDLIAEFGKDGIESVIEKFIAAEQADFCWEGRFAEMDLGEFEGLDELEQECRRVAILGYFQGGYHAAICIVDEEREPIALLRMQEFDSLECAEAAFLASR
jgi:hypothetical protein